MEFVGWRRENDKRHGQQHSEQGQVRAGGDGVGGRGNVRRASQAGAHLSLRRGIKVPHQAEERAELVAPLRRRPPGQQLRRGRKRKSESGLRDWTEAEDIQLLKVVWSGARGEDRCTPTRTASACRQRLQLIRKHVELSTRNSLGMSSTNP